VSTHAESQVRTDQPSVDVLIPNWNGKSKLRRALSSLEAQTRAHGVCVIDNASNDGSVQMVRSEFPHARVIELEANLGFGAAINRGASNSEADLLVLLNNDAVADPGFVEALVVAQKGSGAEMVAGCLLDMRGRVESAGIEVDQSLIPYDAGHGCEYPLPTQLVKELVLIGPCGGAAGYLREAFETAGGFDENLFAYLEDVDLGLRMTGLGMRCVLAPRAFVHHQHSATLGSGSSEKNELMARNRVYLTRKWRAAMSPADRARGVLLDVAVIAGKTAVDRNLGALRGWWDGVRASRMRGRTPSRELTGIPRRKLTLQAALGRRLARRV
jgi:GT2 family glycosyltransferase